MRNAGIHFVRPPIGQPYGTVAVFEDLYGNLWDLIQRRRRDGRIGDQREPRRRMSMPVRELMSQASRKKSVAARTMAEPETMFK